MRPESIPKPTKEQWNLTALQSERRANFPHCLEAVDGKHIRAIKPEHSGSLFYSYQNFFSVVLMPEQTLTAALCTLTLVVTEKTVIIKFLYDLRYAHQFRQICWN
jgi:hypothetical protein